MTDRKDPTKDPSHAPKKPQMQDPHKQPGKAPKQQDQHSTGQRQPGTDHPRQPQQR